MPKIRKRLKLLLIPVALYLLSPTQAKAYAILAHEAVIDAEWIPVLRPLLMQKYPNATQDEIKLAHSYAYGGCLVPDMGYMPLGNHYFTDLMHYVRSGDMVMNLLNQSQNLNEYAFALGVLSHYMADKYGHSLATNQAVPLIYPQLKEKYGSVVTYDEDHTSHSRTEFAYDVVQTAKGSYATQSFHDFIGFNVSVPVLQRAFLITYGEDLSLIMPDINSDIATFRWGVRNLFPSLTKSAWRSHKEEIIKLQPTATLHTFKYRLKRKQFKAEFSDEHKKPGFGVQLLTFLIKICPKIGPLKTLKFVPPTPETEKLFVNSFDTILVKYTAAVKLAEKNKLTLPDINFDTGMPTAVGRYRLADNTYNVLLDNLQEEHFIHVTANLKQHIINFYSGPDTAVLYHEKYFDNNKFHSELHNLETYRPRDHVNGIAQKY